MASGFAGAIDRDPQQLPVPLGDLRPRWRSRGAPATVRLWRRRGPDAVAALGLLLAAAAVLITVTRPPLGVYLQDGSVEVAGMTLLHPADNGGLQSGLLYDGPATLLLVPQPDGSMVAAGVTYLDGSEVTGVCHLGPPTRAEVTERCQLRIGSAAVSCEDVLSFDGQGDWERRCSDGQQLSVSVPPGATVIPMPFPLGR